jgi:hypothetical protein
MEKCQRCGKPEIEAYTPRTVYACGSSDYDQREGTFTKGNNCKMKNYSIKNGENKMILSETKEELLLLALIHRNKLLPAPKKIELFTEHKELTIGIGNDYTATIIIDNDALKELYDMVNVEIGL